MKKSVLLLGAVILLLIAVFFLPKSDESFVSAKDPENTSKDGVTHLRFGHNTPVDSALHEASVRFAEAVRRKSGGKVEVEVFPNQQLGNDHQMVEMARKGELDILLTPTAKMSVPVPSMQYADLPFFFPSREDVYAMLDGEPGRMLLDDLREIGLVGVTFWENGFKHFTANTPLLSPKDFKGKKIRVMKSRIIMEQFKSFGAEPVPIDFHMTRQALADKVVDGEENPLVAIVSMGFHEVQSDLTLSEHAYLGYVFSISTKTMEKLPLEIRTLLVETAREVTPWEREETQKREAKLLEIIKAAGVKVHCLKERDRKKFAALTAHIAREYEPVIGCDVMSKTQELLYNKYGPSPESKKAIVIGIDADLSMGGKTVGLAIKRGVELAVNELNARGGLLGKKLVLIAKDHRGVASKGVENVREFIDRPDTVAIIGGKHSPVIAAEMETIQQAHIPYIVPWAAASEVTENGYGDNAVFRVSLNDSQAAVYLAEQAFSRFKRPAIIVENSIWGRGNLTKMQNHCKKCGTGFAAEIVINRGQTDFSEELQEIRDTGADAIIIVLNTVEGTNVVEAIGKSGLALPVISHWGIVGEAFFQKNRKLLQTLDLQFIQTFSFLRQQHPAAKMLETAYGEYYGITSLRKIDAPVGVAQAYDAVHLLAEAIKKAGTTGRDDVRKALEKLPPYQGAVKRYAPAFSAKRHDTMGKEDFFMAKFRDDGLIIPAREPLKQ